jgi:molybdopterin synthase sulfur carrier subunit
MSVRILYFAWLRERSGRSEEEVALPPSVADVADLVAWLRARGGGPAEALADLRAVRVAVNQEYVTFRHPLKAGDEVAFFPPVTGGAAVSGGGR